METSADAGVGWRQTVKNALADFGITWWDPTSKPNVLGQNLPDEADIAQIERDHGRNGFWTYKALSLIRNVDRRLVTLADFLIVSLDPACPGCGTYEELFLANSQEKPVLILAPKGVDTIPLWILGTLPGAHFAESTDDLFDILHEVDAEGLDRSGRWILIGREDEA